MADIVTTNLDAGTDSPRVARAQLLEVVQRVNQLASLADATKGGGLVVFDPTLNYAAQTIGKRLRDSGMCATDFPWLAKFDGSTDDTAAIQACIDWVQTTQGGGTVTLPAGRAKTSAPLKTYGSIELVGQGAEVTAIEKTTTTVGSGTSRARSAAVTDSYAVDSIVSIWHDDTASGTLYAFRPKLTGLTLEGMGNTYGIYAPRITHAMLEDVQITDVQTGYLTYDAWQCTLRRVVCQGIGYGFRHVDDGSGVGTGTSVHLDNCWCNFDNSVRAPICAFDLYGLTYSVLTACAADNLTRLDTTVPYVYQFATCRGITMTGCGAESSAAGFLSAITSTITIINPRAFAMSCNASWSTSAGIYNDGSTLTFINADLGAWTGAGANFYDQIIQAGANQTEIEGAMPTGGSSFISYGGGSKRSRIAAGVLSVNGVQVLGARDTGWTAMTGTLNESTAYSTGGITLPQLAERVGAIQAALTAHGIIGT